MREKTARTSARRQPRQPRARQTVEAVLDATVKVLQRDGFDSITTNRVAEVAGVCIGSLYQYFPDKYAIYAALHQRHAQETRHLIERTVSRHTTSSLEDLMCALTDALIDAHAGEPELHELLGRHTAPPDGSQGLRGALRIVIASRAVEGARPRSLDQALFVLPGMVDALAHEAVLSRPAHFSLAAAKEEAVRAISSYLRA